MNFKVGDMLTCKTSLRIFNKDSEDSYGALYFDAGKSYKLNHISWESGRDKALSTHYSNTIYYILDNNNAWCSFIDDDSNPDNINLKTLSIQNYFYTPKELRKAKLNELEKQ